jgi:nucleoside-diphosphate-sugar epimerase
MAEKPRLLILGGAGYIGARLADALSDQYEVFVTYRGLPPAREGWLRKTAISASRFDAASDERLPFDCQFDAVLNLAMPGASEAQKDPEGTQTHALRIADLLAKLAAAGGLRRLIHFSSFHVYGAEAGRETFTEADVARPQHPYGRNHLLCEERIQEINIDELFILRPTNIIAAPAYDELGPQSKLFFLSLCRQAAQSGSIKLDNDGLSYRDFISFSDVLAAVRIVLTHRKAGFQLFNLSAGSACRLDTFAETIHKSAVKLLGDDIGLSFGSGIDSWRQPFVVCNQRLRTLGWEPHGELIAEIEATLAFFAGKE